MERHLNHVCSVSHNEDFCDSMIALPGTLPYTRDVSTLTAGSHQILLSFVAVNGATTSSTQSFTVSGKEIMSWGLRIELTMLLLFQLCNP